MTLHKQLTKARDEILFIKGIAFGMEYMRLLLTAPIPKIDLPNGDFYPDDGLPMKNLSKGSKILSQEELQRIINR